MFFFLLSVFSLTNNIAAINVIVKTVRANVKLNAEKKKRKLDYFIFSLSWKEVEKHFLHVSRLLLMSVVYAITGQVNTLPKSYGHIYQRVVLGGHSRVQTRAKKNFC